MFLTILKYDHPSYSCDDYYCVVRFDISAWNVLQDEIKGFQYLKIGVLPEEYVETFIKLPTYTLSDIHHFMAISCDTASADDASMREQTLFDFLTSDPHFMGCVTKLTVEGERIPDHVLEKFERSIAWLN